MGTSSEVGACAARRIGLALSGGGTRAAAFHLGMLRCLANRGLLESIECLSTVSGGSLVTAAVMSHSANGWPSSANYLENVFPALRSLLTGRDLFSFRALGLLGTVRHGSRVLNRRAEILVDLLRRQWGITAKLSDLPERPVWWINATCIETGKNWRFSKREMGDWKFGRHYAPAYSVAEAVAASAAVPYAIGALSLAVPQTGWYDTNPATRERTVPKAPPSNIVNLWDGGAYENMGLEPLYKGSRGLIGCNYLICSDASGPLPAAQLHPVVSLLKGQLCSPRLFDISSDQIRALRSRMVMDAVSRGDIQGVIVRMGNSARNFDTKAGSSRPAAHYDAFLSEKDVDAAASYRTDLTALSISHFDRISRHAEEVTEQTLSTYAPGFAD